MDPSSNSSTGNGTYSKPIIIGGAIVVILTLAAVVGGVCGDGHCGGTTDKSRSVVVPPAWSSTGEWVPIGTNLLGQDSNGSNDIFGYTLVLSANGTRLAIGAVDYVQVLDRSDETWSPSPPGSPIRNATGGTLSLSGDGTRVALCSGNDARVLLQDTRNSLWQQLGNDIDGLCTRQFRQTLALTSTGHRVAIGSPGEVTGQVSILEYNERTTEWEQMGPSIIGSGADFGWAVALSSDGNRLIVGDLADTAGSVNRGNAGIFEWTGLDWTQIGDFIVEGENDGDFCGNAVAISSDGGIVAVGCRYADNEESIDIGSVAILEWGVVARQWSQKGQPIYGDLISGGLGYSVAISADGNTVAVGTRATPSYVEVYYFADNEWVRAGERLVGHNVVDITDNGRIIAVGDFLTSRSGGSARVYQWNNDN